MRESKLQTTTVQGAQQWEIIPVDVSVGDGDAETNGSKGESRAAPGTPIQETPEEVVVTAEKQLTLRCGKASITLTKSGKIILRGKYILSRSEGVNRIKGGSVQIN